MPWHLGAPEHLPAVSLNGGRGAGTCPKEVTMITFMSALRELITLCAYKAKKCPFAYEGCRLALLWLQLL